MEDQPAAASAPQGAQLSHQEGRGKSHSNGQSSSPSSGLDGRPLRQQQQLSGAEELQHRLENGAAEGRALTEAEERRIAADMQEAAKQQAAAGIKPPELRFELRRLHSAVLTRKVCGVGYCPR